MNTDIKSSFWLKTISMKSNYTIRACISVKTWHANSYSNCFVEHVFRLQMGTAYNKKKYFV